MRRRRPDRGLGFFDAGAQEVLVAKVRDLAAKAGRALPAP
jgi:hypothetical protein